MGFGAGDVVGLIWSHPIASLVVALLFTPPLFPFVVFFSPLLISTALVVLAMISMGSDGDDSSGTAPGGYYGSSHYKRDWHEQEETDQAMSFHDDEDGPLLSEDDRRLHKRRKGGVQQDDGWLDKVKSWEETGRAWVDSVLHQEARKPSSHPLFSSPAATTETREVRFAQPIPQPQSYSAAPSQVSSPPADSSDSIPSLEKVPEDEAPGPSEGKKKRGSNEISDEEITEIPARAFPPSADERKSKSSEGDLRAATGADVGPQVVIGGAKAKEQRKEGVQSGTVAREDQNGADAAASAHESSSGNSGEGKSAPGADRERRGEHLRTPSVAVTLSEKLNVPLEDIMSLLAGDEKPSSTRSHWD